MRVSFELDEQDLKHFELIMRDARSGAGNRLPEEIVDGAQRLLAHIRTRKVPAYIVESLAQLETMIAMLTDLEWRLPEQDASHVLNALAYFCEPEDLIPDDLPGLGYLDDAIMVNLVARELRHEIDAYVDFCRFRAERESTEGPRGPEPHVTREQWLAGRRDELQERMRRRRRKSRG